MFLAGGYVVGMYYSVVACCVEDTVCGLPVSVWLIDTPCVRRMVLLVPKRLRLCGR